MSQEKKPDSKATVEEFHGERSTKRLKSATEAVAHQKEYFRSFRERIAQGEPVVWKYIVTPEPIFKTMDLVDYDMQHYSALISAKQMSRYYLDELNNQGYFRDLCRYCTVPLGYAFDKNNEIAPWGGLPKFAAAVFIHNDDPALKIWELYAREFNVPMYIIEFPYWSTIPPMQYGFGTWEVKHIEAHRVGLMVEELQGLIRFLETTTGKHFSMTKLGDVMEKTNAMNRYYGMATNLACETVPAPISWTDALANLPARLYHVGSQYAVDQARKYYEEIKERVDKGEGVCNPEKVRLRYWGHPVWFSLGFFNTWEESYNTVFLPAYYYAGAEFQVVPDLRDPLRALAAVTARAMGIARIPCTNIVNWQIYQNKKYKVDGTIFMVVESCKLLYASVLFARETLEKAGYPTLEINADMVDARDWDDTKMKSLMTSFIETLMD